MPIMEWSSQLDIGVHEMNDQHQVLLDHMNRLFDAQKSGMKYPELKGMLDALTNYTIKHFEDEEAYMQKMGFESVNGHKFIHKQLLEKYTSFLTEAASKNELPDEFYEFLKFWLMAHIQGIDKKYGDFVNHKKSA